MTIGNDLIERHICFNSGNPITDYIRNCQTGHSWCSSQDPVIQSPFPVIEKAGILARAYISDSEGLSAKHLKAEIFTSGRILQCRYEYTIYPGLPFLSFKKFIKGSPSNCSNLVSELSKKKQMNVFDCIDAFGIGGPHFKCKAVKFAEWTDKNDFLVKADCTLLYPAGENSLSGNLFVLDDYLLDEALMIVKEAPSPQCAVNRKSCDLLVRPGRELQILGTGIDPLKLSSDFYTPSYGYTVGTGKSAKLPSLYKKLCRNVCQNALKKPHFIMSNTWGDRNEGKNICRDFIFKELNVAHFLGIDILQIDDGWQKGIDPVRKNKTKPEDGLYAADSHYWDVDHEKFPGGLNPIVQCAFKYGISLSLWFVPDCSHDLENWEKDANTLLGLYKKYKIHCFKLDGVNISDKQGEINFIRLLEKVFRESNNAISFNMDITAQKRFGYLYEQQYGTIFLENRYTDWGNYYPHNTLKNLWCLSRYLPAERFQIEVPNNRRNTEKYNDPLAPSNYTIDYLFAISIAGNPLLWMEMSKLKKEDQEKLSHIISIYKNIRGNLVRIIFALSKTFAGGPFREVFAA